jgi:RNA polymerase sigma-70 factor (ECF subfamily)
MYIAEENRLINDILNGDVQAFAVLVNRYQRPIYNLMLRMTDNREDATDLTQEVFLKVYANLEHFRPSGRFFPWAYTIGINLARDFLRKRNTALKGAHCFQEDWVEDGHANNPVCLMTQVDACRLPGLMAKLPDDYREALILRFHEGLTMKDVGTALSISTSGAKMRVKRGLQKLRDLLRLKCPAESADTGHDD